MIGETTETDGFGAYSFEGIGDGTYDVLAEAIGVRVAMTEGDYSNIKLTTPEDFAVAEALLAKEEHTNG